MARTSHGASSAGPMTTTRSVKDRKDGDTKGAERDTPRWFTLVPKAANSKPRCARYLSTKGCPSTRKGKCTNDDRIHAWPTKLLDDAVTAAITKHWGGVNDSVPKLV